MNIKLVFIQVLLQITVNIFSIFRGWIMVFNTTFNNILVISWRSVLLMEETGVPRENQRPAASH
jgi:hypothetical protein